MTSKDAQKVLRVRETEHSHKEPNIFFKPHKEAEFWAAAFPKISKIYPLLHQTSSPTSFSAFDFFFSQFLCS